eukprot:scpid61536/ scgid30278/ 
MSHHCWPQCRLLERSCSISGVLFLLWTVRSVAVAALAQYRGVVNACPDRRRSRHCCVVEQLEFCERLFCYQGWAGTHPCRRAGVNREVTLRPVTASVEMEQPLACVLQAVIVTVASD